MFVSVILCCILYNTRLAIPCANVAGRLLITKDLMIAC